MISKPLAVKAINQHTIWLKYADGTEGQLDLESLISKPYFIEMQNSRFFQNVYIDKETYAVAWSNEIELCPDSLYLRIKGLTYDEWKGNQLTYAANK